MSFSPNYPVILGLAGGAATGKTTMANALAPIAHVVLDDDNANITWTHLYFAIRIYRVTGARQKIQGTDQFSRQCYEVHDALNDVFRGYVEYDKLVDTVFEVVNYPVDPDDIKPRSFMQWLGTDVCRVIDEDCWVKWMRRKINEEYIRHEQEQDRMEEANPDHVRSMLGVVVSDVRFENECEFIKSQPNGVLVKFTVDPGVAAERIAARDGGAVMNTEQQSHPSENGLNKPKEYFDAVIDTSELDVQQQFGLVKQVINHFNRSLQVA